MPCLFCGRVWGFSGLAGGGVGAVGHGAGAGELGGGGAFGAGIVEAASVQCHVDAIVDAPQGAWPALAATRRVTVSAANLLAYLDEIGRAHV